MKEIELKPCPFCGKPARLEHGKVQLATNSEYADICVSWKVVCSWCGTSKDGGTTFYQFKNNETLEIEQRAFANGREQAISKWNRRADDERKSD